MFNKIKSYKTPSKIIFSIIFFFFSKRCFIKQLFKIIRPIVYDRCVWTIFYYVARAAQTAETNGRKTQRYCKNRLKRRIRNYHSYRAVSFVIGFSSKLKRPLGIYYYYYSRASDDLCAIYYEIERERALTRTDRRTDTDGWKNRVRDDWHTRVCMYVCEPTLSFLCASVGSVRFFKNGEAEIYLKFRLGPVRRRRSGY